VAHGGEVVASDEDEVRKRSRIGRSRRKSEVCVGDSFATKPRAGNG
jgi:hypothetical protein